MEFIEKEVASFGLPKYDYFQQKVRSKISLSLVLDESDYDIICNDFLDNFKLTERIEEFTKEQRDFLIKKYFAVLKDSKMLFEINKRLTC